MPAVKNIGLQMQIYVSQYTYMPTPVSLKVGRLHKKQKKKQCN